MSTWESTRKERALYLSREDVTLGLLLSNRQSDSPMAQQYPRISLSIFTAKCMAYGCALTRR